jgi:hypothetical protein
VEHEGWHKQHELAVCAHWGDKEQRRVVEQLQR